MLVEMCVDCLKVCGCIEGLFIWGVYEVFVFGWWFGLVFDYYFCCLLGGYDVMFDVMNFVGK